MDPRSLVGFGVVFVMVLWISSALATLLVRWTWPRLKAAGPLAERRAAEIAAVLPVVSALALTATLMIDSAYGLDHCTVHGHHAHLCLVHGGVWLNRGWAVALLGGAAVFATAKLGLVALRVIRGRASLALLGHAAVKDGEVYLADSPRPFCFVAGVVRPRIYASTAAWSALEAQERAAVVAHEQAHVALGDLRRRLVIDGALALAAPLAATILRSIWAQATERLCDARAAQSIGRPDVVAQALVHFCRLGSSPPMGQMVSFPPRGADLAERVHAVLQGGSDGRSTSRRFSIIAALFAGKLVALSTWLAEPLHHALETLLG